MSKSIYAKQIEILTAYYPEACCSLNFNSPFELVIALILAAQCTDERVNKTLPNLILKYPTVDKMAMAEILDVQNIVRSCGFYKNKANNIIACSKMIMSNFNGIVPNNMDDLLTLRGIGRKSSNVILQECFGKVEGIVVDTHVTRIANKLGMTKSSNPGVIEKDIMKKLPKKYWRNTNHVLVFHGRNICIARRPKCSICPINDLCKNKENAKK